MATHYVIKVDSLNGEHFSDTIEYDLRDTIESLAKDPLFNLGQKITTKRDPERDEFMSITYHYYHNGRITVTTRRHQLTYNQRSGRRSY